MEKEIYDIMAQNNNISADQGQKSKERKKKNTSFATDSQENDSAFKDRSPDKTLSIKSYKVQNTH